MTASSDSSVPIAVTCSLSGAAITFAASTGTTSLFLSWASAPEQTTASKAANSHHRAPTHPPSAMFACFPLLLTMPTI